MNGIAAERRRVLALVALLESRAIAHGESVVAITLDMLASAIRDEIDPELLRQRFAAAGS